MSDQFDQFDLLGQVAQEAEEGAVRSNFGKLSVEVTRYIHWVDNYAVDVEREEFSKLGRNERSVEVTFGVDIQDFNPQLEFVYERRVTVPGKDWHGILKKSIAEVLGKNAAKNFTQTFKELNGKYVEVHDVPQVKGGQYNTVKLAKVFRDRDECFAAYVERFGDPAERAPSTTSAPTEVSDDFPPGYDAASWESTKPFIKEALDSGTPPPQIAKDYGIANIKFIMQVKNEA